MSWWCGPCTRRRTVPWFRQRKPSKAPVKRREVGSCCDALQTEDTRSGLQGHRSHHTTHQRRPSFWLPTMSADRRTDIRHQPKVWHALASLRLVSLGAATEGVTPIFSWKNWRPFLVITLSVSLSFLRCQPYLFSREKLTTFFAHHCHFYWFLSDVTHLEDVTPHILYPSDLVCPLFFVNSPTFFSFGCQPWMVSSGMASRPTISAPNVGTRDNDGPCSAGLSYKLNISATSFGFGGYADFISVTDRPILAIGLHVTLQPLLRSGQQKLPSWAK